MKRILIALFALCLAMPALAGHNLRQQDSGGAVWVDPDGQTIPVGDTGIVVYVDDFGIEATHWIVTHKQGRVAKVYTVTNNSWSGDTVLNFGTREQGGAIDSNSQLHIGESSDGTKAATIGMTASGSAAGDVDSVDLTNGQTNTSVTPGMSIFINSDGGASSAVSGYVLIIIE